MATGRVTLMAKGGALESGPPLRLLGWAILESNQRPLPCEASATFANTSH